MYTPPQVSVIIPTRNREMMLRRAIKSVLEQTDVNVEVIIVDDGSIPAIQRSSLPPSEGVTLVRSSGLRGAQHARMIGLEHARGEYAAFLDSDDWWHARKIRQQLDLATAIPDTLICCRVIATHGALKRAAPWRTLAKDERVETFLYVHEGMLQTSTIFAKRELLIKLVSESIDSKVHNDTRIFISAQKACVPILQMAEALAYFDDAPRRDRVSFDANRLADAERWFEDVSSDWTEEAKRGYILTDLVKRNVNAGRRWSALQCLFRSWHPQIPKVKYLKQALYILCNGSPRTLLSRLRGAFSG